MPFGVMCSSHAANKKMYPSAIREIARVVKPGGMIGLLTSQKKLMVTLLQKTYVGTQFVEQVKTMTVNMNGLPAELFILKRNDKAWNMALGEDFDDNE